MSQPVPLDDDVAVDGCSTQVTYDELTHDHTMMDYFAGDHCSAAQHAG